MTNNFVHLHVHSEYSLVDGMVRIKPLVSKTMNAGMPALALTEQSNFFSLVKFYEQAHKSGIKPVAGVELRIIDDNKQADSSRILILCQHLEGYRSLCRLVTRSYTEGQVQGVPYIRLDWLKDTTEGLIALSCARDGNIGQAIINGNQDLAKSSLAEWMKLFPDRFYLELQRTSRAKEDIYIDGAVKLADSFGAPVVATNDVRFLEEEDFAAHEARVCIQQSYTLNDPRRPHLYSPQQYLRSPDEMQVLFEDIPEAIENTGLIAQRCNLELTLGEYYLPNFPVPDDMDEDSCLREASNIGLQTKLKELNARETADTKQREEEYQQRLDTELDVISNMGFPGYFLIVADFIQWAKDQDIPVGPGRGSGAGSLVAYVLGITELDPIEYELLFERFLNPERVSLPDFDIDFCMDRRDEVIEYVSKRYGSDRVSQIITYGSMAAKAVVRDVGRVLSQPYGFVDQIAKLIPFDIGMTLDQAMKDEPMLKKRYKEEEEVSTLIDLAKKLEGLSRNAGKHAGGLIIAPRPLTDYMPLYCEQGSTVTSSQFDMGDVESIGLVKFDFLGLRTLTIIDWAVKDANKLRANKNEPEFEILKIPLNDEPTYELIRAMQTTSIFQLESDGMKKLIGDQKPDCFDDLVALVALFRPGPLQSGMVDDFINRKHGARVDYPHPSLEQVLKPTYGVILYQEQVMQIAQVLSGYTLGGADLLRRAMGKKKEEEMAKQRSVFVEGAVKNGVEEKVATGIFNLIELFAGYGFNKSHSAAYALLAYQTAWLKTHYPAAFMAAVFSSDMDNTDKSVILSEELNRMKLTLLSPSVNESEYKFSVADESSIRFGLGAIKGVGEGAIENIVVEREENGSYKDLFDFCKRVDLRKANKRVLEALIRSGAADELGPSRSIMMASIGNATQIAEQLSQNKSRGQDDMFGLEANADTIEEDNANAINSAFIDAVEWDDHKRLLGEKETLGFYFKGHPIMRYEQELSRIPCRHLHDVRPGTVIVAGYIESIRMRSGSRGKTAEVRLDDRTARMQLTLYPEVNQRYRDILVKDKLVIVTGEAKEDDYKGVGFFIEGKEVFTLEQYRQHHATLRLKIGVELSQDRMLDDLLVILSTYKKGNCPVTIEYKSAQATSFLRFGDEWRVRVNEQLLVELGGLLGADKVELDYT